MAGAECLDEYYSSGRNRNNRCAILLLDLTDAVKNVGRSIGPAKAIIFALCRQHDVRLRSTLDSKRTIFIPRSIDLCQHDRIARSIPVHPSLADPILVVMYGRSLQLLSPSVVVLLTILQLQRQRHLVSILSLCATFEPVDFSWRQVT